MADQEIPRERWQEVLQAFTRQYHSVPVALEHVAAGARQVSGDYHPLERIAYTHAKDVEIVTAGDILFIEHPRRLRVREAGGLHWALEIEGAGGALTILRLRHAVTPDMLDGLEPPMSGQASPLRSEIDIPVSGGRVSGSLSVPGNARGIVTFAHGSGSSRFSPRNQLVAGSLQSHGFATLLMDLLTPAEERIDDVTAELRFDIPFLARRLVEVTDWTQRQPSTHALPVGYFGASTGAAAALVAAAGREDIGAIVSRGGRPDLAGDALLERVATPTLLLVGGNDPTVITLNRQAYEHLRGVCKLEIIPGASHLFEEPGKLEQVAARASEWFTQYLTGRDRRVA